MDKLAGIGWAGVAILDQKERLVCGAGGAPGSRWGEVITQALTSCVYVRDNPHLQAAPMLFFFYLQLM